MADGQGKGMGLFAVGTLRGIRNKTIKTDSGAFERVTAVLDRGNGYDLYICQYGEGGEKMRTELEKRIGSRVELEVYAGNYRELRYLSLVA